LASSRLDAIDVVAEESSDRAVSTVTGEGEPAQVGDVENTDTRSDRAMLGEHRFVLNRHLPTPEIDEACA
jgi:hypothetical protein